MSNEYNKHFTRVGTSVMTSGILFAVVMTWLTPNRFGPAELIFQFIGVAGAAIGFAIAWVNTTWKFPKIQLQMK
jgi:hypothetical protein